MISCTPLNKLLYPAAASRNPSSETQSEISSADSDWSDIRSIALKLGVQNPDDLHTERFKVDRQKLENMIKTESSIDGLNSAEYFFENVMKSTETHISWPCRLKIGAKSKKDPHVRIVGKPDEVVRAKERVLANLDSRGTRVIMKMDVSYTDHSFIIGRGGGNIKRIMETTNTHIHFPDSNRSNPTEKSNQVSLCGTLEGVERARTLVRLSTPVLISFELPIMAPGRSIPDRDTPYINMIETKYNVQVIFSSRPKLHSSLVLVKGSEKESTKVQEATELLINYTCEDIANQIFVHMQLEISPQHHEIVKGQRNMNLLSIMERTKTKIIFPDLSDMNVKPLKKSQVTITGTIDGVYNARQQLVGNLPVVLIFDFPDNQNNASEILTLSTKYGVSITLRQKQRQNTLAIVIKGIEKFIDKVYEARHDVLQLTTELIKPEIPESYFAPNDKELSNLVSLSSLLAGHLDSPKTGRLIGSSGAASPLGNNNITPQNRPSMIGANNNNNIGYHSLQGTPTGICALPTHKVVPPPPEQMFNFQYILPNFNNNNINNLPPGLPTNVPTGNRTSISPRNSFGQNTSGYQSFSSSTTSLERSYPPFGGRNNRNLGIPSSTDTPSVPPSQHSFSPDSTYASDNACRARRSSDGVLLGLGGGGLGSSGDVNHNPYSFSLDNRSFDFDYRRVIGLKAMDRQPISSEVRTPNTNWIGLSLSRTSPANIESVEDFSRIRNNPAYNYGQTLPYGLGATTGLVDSTPTNRRLQLSKHKDIHSLLTSLGLEHYIKIFVLNEIDLDMFITLTEDNLVELGISAFGARRKLLVAIHSLQANESSTYFSRQSASSNANSSPRFSGSAAPGAERRTSNAW